MMARLKCESWPMNALGWSRIFHPTDFTVGDEGALVHALKLALLNRCELDLMHTGTDGGELSWRDFPQIRRMLAEWGAVPPGASHKECAAQLGLDVKKIQKTGPDPVESIVAQALETEPDLLVLATHQRQGLDRWTHRSVAEPVARNVGGLTLFVPRRVVGFVSRETGAVRLQNVVIPLDHSPRPQMAVDAALAVANAAHAAEVRFTLLHVGLEEDMPKVNVPEVAGWHFERTAWQGNVVDHILAVCEERNADLIVMATHGHDGFLDALRGNTTERVLRAAKCPLLAAFAPP